MNLSHAALARVIGKWSKRLGLAGWQIGVRVLDVPLDEGDAGSTAASIEVEDGYKIARITVYREQIRDARELDRVIVHELLHAVLWRLSSVAAAGSGSAKDAVRAIEEEAIESIARALTCR